MESLSFKKSFATLYSFKLSDCIYPPNGPYKIKGCSNPYGYRLRLQANFNRDLKVFFDKLQNFSVWERIEIIDNIIEEIRERKDKYVDSFSYKGVSHHIFLRTDISKSYDTKESHALRLFEFEPYVDCFLEEMEGLIRTLLNFKTQFIVSDVDAKPQNSRYRSFPYKYYRTDIEKLKNLRNGLIEKEFIFKVNQQVFDKVFSGEEIKSPIKWRSALYDLHYFINGINNVRILHEKIKQQWKLASMCFIDNKGKKLTPHQISDASDKRTRKDDLDQLILLL